MFVDLVTNFLYDVFAFRARYHQATIKSFFLLF